MDVEEFVSETLRQIKAGAEGHVGRPEMSYDGWVSSDMFFGKKAGEYGTTVLRYRRVANRDRRREGQYSGDGFQNWRRPRSDGRSVKPREVLASPTALGP